MKLRALYTDLDGTLLGARASLLHDRDGAFTLAGVRALEACARAGIEVIPFSGRRQASLAQDARLLGMTSYVFEAGAGVVLDGEIHWLTDQRYESIEASGAPALLMERLGLVYHDPWHLGREVSHLFRGDVDAGEADALLEAHGHTDLRLVDNGRVRGGMRAYHLVPKGVSKADGVAAHMRMRGYEREAVMAVGDSREDASVAAVVGAFWLVANADTEIAGRRAEAPNGAGVYEAVMTELAERRAP